MGEVDEAPATHKRKLRRLGALRRERRFAIMLLIVGCLGLVVAATALAVARHQTTIQPAYVVQAPDSNRDQLTDVLSNAVGVDPFAPTPQHALPGGWVQRYRLSLDDPDLANRTAPIPLASQTPAVYGVQGFLSPEFRMTYWDVYAYGRPAAWNESAQGPFDSHLDPTRWDTDNTTGVPYMWLIHFGLDPFDAGMLDRVYAGANVSWTPREAYERGLDPVARDGDADGIPDDVELQIGTNPRMFSTIGMNISDGWLVAHHFDPLDRAVPYQEIAHRGETVLQTFEDSARLYPNLTGPPTLGGLDPRAISTVGGPIPDVWLIKYEFDPLDPHIASKVIHTETIANATGNHTYSMTLLDAYNVDKPPSWNESRNGPWWGGVDPRKNDTDGDGLTDLEEIVGWDITVGGQVVHVTSDPMKADTDGDGLTDKQEHDGAVGNITFPPTNPRDADTDGDGLTDGQELGVVLYRGHVMPQLDPTDPDTAHQGLMDGEAADYWIDRVDECRANGQYQWGEEPRPTVAEALFGHNDISLCSKLAPENDLRGTGKSNILNPDVDGDGLLNGWEIHPRTYVSSPYAPGSGEPSRSATDPANNDTDGDGLPDGWEVKYGVPLPDGRGWNIDPAKWSSLGDGVSDADEDLVNDTAAWYSYKLTASGTVTVQHVFERTNLESYKAGANPNLRSSSPDDISDAWKIFWGLKYFGLSQADIGDIYPGAPGPLHVPSDRSVPLVGNDDNQLVTTTLLHRYLLDDSTNDTVPGCADHRESITTLQGTHLKVCLVTLQLPYDYRAIAENATNPYVSDTSGDGLPDAWKAAWSWLGIGRPDRVNAVLPGATLDPSGKGLSRLEDYQYGTDPYVADSDLGGVPDSQEVKLGLNPMDPTDDVQGANQGLDSDRDGIPNVQEVNGYLDARGDVVKTNPFLPDTDHDGLLDGRSLHNVVGHRLMLNSASDAALLASLEAEGLLVVPGSDGSADVLGEQDVGTDPTRVSTANDGVPDGWNAVYGVKITDAASRLADYTYGRPSWWNESLDGTWRWGLLPGEPPTDDHDHDGLNDMNGEDPIPYANPLNVLPRGNPREPGINASERLERSQAYGDGYRSVMHPLQIPDVSPPRVDTVLTLASLGPALRGDGLQNFTGHLWTLRGEPVRNATIILSLGTQSLVLGAAITNETGAFDGIVGFASVLAEPAGSIGVPLFGSLDGTGTHSNPANALPPLGASTGQQVFAWAYNESWNPLPRQAHPYTLEDGTSAYGIVGGLSDPQSVTLLVPTQLSFDVPASGKVLSVVVANVTLRDAWGRAVSGTPVCIEPGNITVTTDGAGAAEFNFTLPESPGTFTFRASYAGSDSFLPVDQNKSMLVSQPTHITAIAPPAPVAPGQQFAVSGVLLTTAGHPVANATVHMDIGEEIVSSATGTSGAFRLVAMLPNSTTTPPFEIAVVYDGNASLDGTQQSLDVPVVVHPRWIASLASAEAGAPASITAVLVDAGGAPQAGVPFKLTTSWGARVDGVTVGGGTARAIVDTTRATPGEWQYTISETGAVQGPTSATQTLLVTSATILTIDHAQLVLGAPDYVRGSLTDAQGRALAGRLVTVQVGAATRPVFTSGEGTFNVSISLPPSTTVGGVAASAGFAGTSDGVYRSSHAGFDARVQNAASIAVPDLDVVMTRPAIGGTITNLLGQPIVEGYVQIDVEGTQTISISGSDGSFHAALDIAPGTKLGDHPMIVTVRGETDLQETSATFTITLKSPATLGVDTPTHVIVGKNTTFRVNAYDADGRPVAGVTLSATIDRVPAGLDFAGDQAVLHVPPTLRSGLHHLLITGYSPIYKVTPWAGDIDVQVATVISGPQRPAVIAGQQGFLTLQVTSGNEPVRNATLTVTIPGSSPLQVQTDATGAADVPLPPALAATTLSIAYAGDATHGPALARATVHVEVAPPSTNLWIIVLLASTAVVLVASVWWVRRRRRSAVDVAGLMAKVAHDIRTGKADLRILYTIYLELVQLANLTEEAAESMTFREVLSRFLHQPAYEADTRVLNRAFDAALYGVGLPENEWVDVATAFDRLSTQLIERARLAHASPKAT